LTDNKYRSESIIRELRAKLKGTEEVGWMDGWNGWMDKWNGMDGYL
jgi:hypothetical protein